MAPNLRLLLLPVFIFILALILRVYHLPSRYSFTADEEYQSTYARTIINDFHPVWIGVSAGDTGFYLGPYFTYFTAFWLALSHGDPLLTAYVAAILGSVTCVLLYFLGKAIAGSKVGTLSALFYALSPLLIYHDQRYWNPSPSALLSVLLLLSLIKLKDSSWWLLVIAFCLGAFWHVHLSLVPLSLVAIYGIWKNRAIITPKVWLISFVVFIAMLAPLFIFDYYHGWSNLSTPLRLLSRESRGTQALSHLSSLGQTLARTLYLSPGTDPAMEIRPGQPGSLWTAPSFAFTVLALIGLLIPTGNIYLSLTLVLMALSYIFYPGMVAPYYLLALLPIYLLVLSRLFVRLRLGYFTLLIFAVLSLRTILATDEHFGLAAKHDLITQVTQFVGGNNFSLSEEGTNHKYGGWRYLFSVYGQYPVSSSADASLAWLYPAELGGSAQYQVLVGATSEFESPVDSLAVYRSGGYTAVITYAK